MGVKAIAVPFVHCCGASLKEEQMSDVSEGHLYSKIRSHCAMHLSDLSSTDLFTL